MSRKTPDHVKQSAERFEQAAASYFPKLHEETPDLEAAMHHSFFAGGKRIRPVLAITVTELLGFPVDDIIPAALAIEMIHTYSLIHDDLPAMDDDDYRRGKPTCHKMYGEATAILAGDGLLTEAFHVAARFPEKPALAAGRLHFIQALADAAGVRGMVGGQAMDMHHPAQADNSFLELLHGRKTAAMIRISCMAPALLFSSPAPVLDELDAYGNAIGLLFQVVDDILDETADFASLGKTPGKDREQNKLTYPALHGLSGARNLADQFLGRALDAASQLPDDGRLAGLARFIHERTG